MRLRIQEKHKGIFYIILSAFFFGFMNMLVRLSGDLPSYQKSLFRNLISFFCAVLLFSKSNVRLKRLERVQWFDLILRAVFGSVGILCNFYAVDHMLVANASMLNKLSPFFVILCSALILREHIRIPQFLCVMTAFAGMLFIIKPGVAGMEMGPALIGLLGGIAAGIAYTLVRKLGKSGVPGVFIVLFFSAFSCVAMLLLLLIFGGEKMTLAQCFFLLAAGLAAAGGQFSVTAAYTHAPGSEISIYDYSQIIFVMILSFVFLGELPDAYSVLGYVIIIGASVLMFFYHEGQNKRQGM